MARRRAHPLGGGEAPMLEALGNVGDFTGGLGVVVTLVYPAMQVRQNSEQIRESASATTSCPPAGPQASKPTGGRLADPVGRANERLTMRPTAAHAAGVALIAAFVPFLSGGCHGPPSAAYSPGLGEIMSLLQMRHIKLWFAGEAENWPLADYELDELEEGFADAARLHPTLEGAPRPLTDLVPEFTASPLQGLRAAVADRDASSFVAAYDSLTSSCNGCHRTVGFSFNVVSRPTMNPYSNQRFRPAP